MAAALARGLAIWAVFVAAYFAWSAAFGHFDSLFDAGEPFGLATSARVEVVLGLLIAFLVVARGRITRGDSAWATVQPLTGLAPDEFDAMVRGELAKAYRSRPLLDAAGALVGVVVLMLSRSSAFDPAFDATFVWAVGANALVFVLLARSAAASVLGRTTQRVADAIERIDLLDTRPLQCFARQGLRIALFWFVGSSIASLIVWNLDRAAPTIAIVSGTLAVATWSLVDPVRSIRCRIVAAKDAELERVRARIRDAREKLVDSGGDAGELPALLAWERRVGDVPEWPFDVSTLLRFGALALLATGSWLGGAVMERLLDAALG